MSGWLWDADREKADMTDPPAVAPIEIREIDRLTLQPGDRLIAYTEHRHVTPEEARAVADRLRAALRLPDIPVAVCGSDWQISVIEAVHHGDAARGERL